MSAIAGIVHFNKEPVDIEHVSKMMGALEKFPADDIQVWRKDNVFFGNHAQWITPESVGEQQPFYDSVRQCVITADAIIDNREELFQTLQVDKEDQKTIPDTLLILLAYYKWGEDCPKHLIGDFAFMIWDEKEQKLFGARDPSGYRTLYYFQDKDRLVFSTIIEPILKLPYLTKELNEEWLAEYLAITGMIDTVEARTTPYKNIEQIPPHHTIVVKNGEMRLHKYGKFYPEKKIKYKTDDEYVEAFQEVFQKAVTARLRTHKNIGSHLSGGLDSGAVVGFAARELNKEHKTLHTFSYLPPSDFVDFTSKRVMPDETPYIKKTVDYVGGINDHYFHFDGISSYTELDSILGINEMPYKFFENSFWLKWIFIEAYNKKVGVLLNGDAGNLTVSWGKALNYYGLLMKRLKWFQLVQELNQYSIKTGGDRLRTLPLILKMTFPRLYKLGNNNDMTLPKLLSPEFAEQTKIYSKLEANGFDQSGWFSGFNVYEHRRRTVDEMAPWNSSNTLYTKLSLKYPLWKRDPTYDIRVVRFCLSIPESQYVQYGMDRALIRRSTENILPDEIRLNQKVKGIQAADWVHRMIPSWDAFTNEIKNLVEEKNIIQYFNKDLLIAALSKAIQGPKREYIIDPDYHTLTQSLVIYRFIKKEFERR